jgi:hypothetical protein
MNMNKIGQSFISEILIALAIACTGAYIIYYAIVHRNMQCSILGQTQGAWCVIGLIIGGLACIILGIYGIYLMIRGGGTPYENE